MNDYNSIRTFVDSYGLGAMMVVFAVMIFWALRPGLRRHYDDAAKMIFAEDAENEPHDGDQSHG